MDWSTCLRVRSCFAETGKARGERGANEQIQSRRGGQAAQNHEGHRKEYRGAAIEAHAVVTLGRLSDEPTVSRYCGDADTYKQQLRELEKFVQENPKAAEGRFLLGYHCLLAGNKDAAKKHLEEAVKYSARPVEPLPLFYATID